MMFRVRASKIASSVEPIADTAAALGAGSASYSSTTTVRLKLLLPLPACESGRGLPFSATAVMPCVRLPVVLMKIW